MSGHGRGSGPGTAWLVANRDDSHYAFFWYTGTSVADGAGETVGATTTVAAGWARVRMSHGALRTPDHRSYWAKPATHGVEEGERS